MEVEAARHIMQTMSNDISALQEALEARIERWVKIDFFP